LFLMRFNNLQDRAPMKLRLNPSRRCSPERAWAPLSDDEWAAIFPFVFRNAEATGRSFRDPRGRLDAVFRLAAHALPGRAPPPRAALPPEFGKPDIASRRFHRWVAAGLWTRLLEAFADSDHPGGAAHRRPESWIRRAHRRAWRTPGVPGAALARRLGFLSALRGPPWLLPDPDLSERVFRRVQTVLDRLHRGELRTAAPGLLRVTRPLSGAAAGRRRMPRCLAPP
jgi:transposase